MRKFITKLLLFLSLVLLVDFVVGSFGEYMVSHSTKGSSYQVRYISNDISDSILILGSSRAVHHYVPSIITEKTGMSCYNVGHDGSGIIYNYGIFSVITSTHKPRYVIYDICPKYDLFKDDNSRYLANLKLYYGHPNIRKLFEDINWKESIKMTSNMYKYNSRLLELFSDYRGNTVKKENLRGYLPKFNTMSYVAKPNPDFIYEHETDEQKLKYLEMLIDECDSLKINLIFVVSPCYKYSNDDLLKPIKAIAKSKHISFVNHFSDTYISTDSTWWADGVHLNDNGAKKWTLFLTEEFINNNLKH